MANELFVLAELDNLNAIFTPLKSTHRIKYTSFSVSQNFLVFGATSGGLYVFQREPCIFLHLLPNKEGSITQVSVSPDEKFFAFSTVKGAVCILEKSQSLKVRCIQMSLEHHGSDITALQWNVSGNELFVGDDSGKVSVISASPFVAKSMFQTSSFVLMQLDSRIVQLDWRSELLLVSTLSRCYVCDSVKEQYRQIGHKLREGEYGACFYADDSHELLSRCEQRSSATASSFSSPNEGDKFVGCESVWNLKMFCARPGSRLWEVHVDGTVLSTHHFKQAFAVPPACVIRSHKVQTSHREGSVMGETSQNEPWGQQSFNFRKLHVIAKKFLFTFRRDGLYVLDPSKSSVVLWSNSFTDIVDAKTLDDTIYLWTASGNTHAVVMLPVDEFLVRLYLRKQYALCAQLCQQYNDYLMKLVTTSSKLLLLADLGTKLDDEVAGGISPLLQEIEKHVQQKQNAQRLKSGIFLVENVQFRWGREEEGEEKSVALYPDVPAWNVIGQKGKSRSLTASPENSRTKKSGSSQQAQKSVGSTSLPELAGVSASAEDVLFHRNICAVGVPYSSNGNLLVSQVNSKLKAHTKQSNPESTFPPEVVQALKELKHSVSWKSLKDKWLVLESKMKLLSQDAAFEPLDIRPAEYHEAVLEEEHSCEGVELVHSCSNKSRHRTSHFPVLDTSDVISLCNRFAAYEQNGSDTSELMCKLLNAVSNIYDLFVTDLIKTHCGMTGDVLQSSDLKSEFNIITVFPFSHYFSDDILKIICDKFHLSLQTKDLITWLQDRIEYVKLTDQFPEHFKGLYTEDTLKIDILLSNFLVIFSELFDPMLTLHYIQTSELHCYYLSLCVILDRYEEGNLSCVDNRVSERAACEVLPPPLLLSTIFFMLRMERVETCCELSERACVKDVWYLVTRLQQQMQRNGVDKDAARLHSYSLFLSYLEKMPASNDCLLKVFADAQLSSYVTAAFEELNSAMGSSCVCGFPLLRPRVVHFSWLAEAMVLYHWESSQSCLMELCKKVPSLWHFVLPHKRSEGFSSVLPLVIHLDDVLELGNWVPYMSHANWVKTLDLLITFHAGTCLNCGSVFTISGDEPRGMSWSSVGLLIVKALGPHEAVELLMKYVRHIKSGDLDARFFQACIYSAILDNHAKGLRDTVVDVLSDCSKGTSGPALFSPAVGPAVEEALKRDLGKHVEFPVAAEKHHWGVKVNIVDGNCPRCALPLGSPVLMKDGGGVTTFCCGHSFHEVCLRRQTQSHTCPICTKNS